MSTQPKLKSILSRRYIVSAVVGASVGFFGQLVADFAYLRPDFGNENLLCSNWVPGPPSMFEALHDDWTYKRTQLEFKENAGRAYVLTYQASLLSWLCSRGEIAARTAALAALLLASSVYTVDRLIEKRDVQKAQEIA